jgi:hypothetical protein
MTNPYPEICTKAEEAELFFDTLAFRHELLKKEIQGRVVLKSIRDREVPIDRRYFTYTGNKFRLMAYAFSKDPLKPDEPLFLRGQVLRMDFIQHEERHTEKSRTRNFTSEPIFGLGYKTPIDMDTFFYWGQMGSFGEYRSRVKTNQFVGDFEGSMKRMLTFDKKALIQGSLVTWNPKSEMGIIDTELRKKIFVKRSDIPEEIKKIKKGLKLRLRISYDLDQPKALDVLPG